MLKKVIPVTMSGTLEDLLRHYPGLGSTVSSSERLNQGASYRGTLTAAFAGEAEIRPKFRIPAADTGDDIFFDNRELLCRFASVPLPTQKEFLRTLRAVFLSDDKPEEIRIEVHWSGNAKTKRTIQVKATHDGQILDFDLI